MMNTQTETQTANAKAFLVLAQEITQIKDKQEKIVGTVTNALQTILVSLQEINENEEYEIGEKLDLFEEEIKATLRVIQE